MYPFYAGLVDNKIYLIGVSTAESWKTSKAYGLFMIQMPASLDEDSCTGLNMKQVTINLVDDTPRLSKVETTSIAVQDTTCKLFLL